MNVESEAIQAIRYDEKRSKLFVRFHDGDEYVYVGVPGEIHRSFLDARSKGSFFSDEIRDRFPFNKLEH